jgi:hypothetical protein
LVRDILRGHGSEPIELPPDAALQADAPAEVPASVVASACAIGIILNQEKWAKLSATQRYALTKLIDPAKTNKRRRALAEFLS